RLPSQAADSVATRDKISAQFAEYLDRLLTPEQRGHAGIHPWDATLGYMRWYFRISHLYIMPLPLGDPPRPCEYEAIIEEEVGAKGPLATGLHKIY
ncbi:hypothetical protein A2U01_0050225, partial [Trifolium medium]|nr:hypothetical protein [Trifolium medium]